jgi:5,10-methylenetetrahydromethanopterin reductase
MNIGVLTIPRDSEKFLYEVTLAEDQGFDLVGVADSQCLMQELYMSMGMAAHHTEDIEIASSVTNPVTRHPAVTSSALCTLDEHSSGRAVLGLASGDSAVYTLGKSAASLRELKEFIDLFHALCHGKEVEYDGYEVGLTWLQMKDDIREIPVMLAAEGPKTLHMAGEMADRVLIGGGTTTEVVEEAIHRIDAGAKDAGRDPDEIEKWVFARSAVVEDRNEIEETLKSTVAAAGHHTLQFTLEGKKVPTELEEDVIELVRKYDSEQHLGLGDDPANRRLIVRLGLTEYLIDRFSIVGSPDDVIRQIEDLQNLEGIDGIHFNPVHKDATEFMERMGREVLPAL